MAWPAARRLGEVRRADERVRHACHSTTVEWSVAPATTARWHRRRLARPRAARAVSTGSASTSGCTLPGGRVLFTTRRGGVSAPPCDTLNLGVLTADDPAAVSANRDRLAALTGIARERTLQGLQVHATAVRRVLRAARPRGAARGGRRSGDRSARRRRRRADRRLPARRARRAGGRRDRPRRLARPRRRRPGRGRPRAARARRRAAGCAPRSGRAPARAATRPAPRCTRRSPRTVPARAAASNADLKHVARRQLEEAGVDDVLDVGLCTLCAPAGLFFSHRRDGAATGRQAGVVWREPWPS